MFKFAPKGLVNWPVKLATRNEGELVEHSAMFLFRVLTRSELQAEIARRLVPAANALVEAMRQAKSGEDASDVITRAMREMEEGDKLLRERVVGWRDIVDESGEPIPFSLETLNAMLEDPLLYGAIKQGLMDASNGAVAKNSQPGAAG